MRKVLAVLSVCLLIFGVVTALGSSTPNQEAPAPSAAPQPQAALGSVYYLNFKPEQSVAWDTLAKRYTNETGVPVTVVTAASGTYEDTLRAEMEKTEPPTLFQVNGPVGLRVWATKCLDLRQTALAEHLPDETFLLKQGDEALAMAYAIETYGLIVNKSLLQKAGYAVEDIMSFEKLKAVAEDIQARREEIGILGAFTSAGMDPSSDWRFKTHLANLPIAWEYRDAGVDRADSLRGTYLDNYQQLWDLYLQNATCDPALIGAKTGEDAASEFALGEAVFYQNGTWAYQDIVAEGLTDDDLAMIPLYMGLPGEENQGLCTGSENYWCINRDASDEDIEATAAFVKWLITSDEGKNALVNDMGFVTPYTQDMVPANALQKAATDDLASGREPVKWAFTTIPSDTWKNRVGAALLEYAQGTGGWDGVHSAFVDGWAAESAQQKGN